MTKAMFQDRLSRSILNDHAKQDVYAVAKGTDDVNYLHKLLTRLELNQFREYLMNNVDIDLVEYLLEEYQSNVEFEEGLAAHYRCAMERFEAGDIESYQDAVRFIFTYLN